MFMKKKKEEKTLPTNFRSEYVTNEWIHYKHSIMSNKLNFERWIQRAQIKMHELPTKLWYMAVMGKHSQRQKEWGRERGREKRQEKTTKIQFKRQTLSLTESVCTSNQFMPKSTLKFSYLANTHAYFSSLSSENVHFDAYKLFVA